MTLTTALADRVAAAVGARTSRRGFLTRTALVGSALTVGGPAYVLRPGSAYAQVTRVTCADCGSGLCCDGYTEFCCHLDAAGANECPPGTLLAGWWKVDQSDFCFGTARYYMDCNRADPGCGCGTSGSCQDDPAACGCSDCQSRKDTCTVFRYGNCNNQIACVGPIVCRVVTCTKPWEIEPNCSQVPRTDERTRNHHRPCLERDPDARELAFVRALYADFLGRASDATGEAYWGERLVRGAHLDTGVRDVIGHSFAFSDEYSGVAVDDVYRTVFQRSADAGGRAFWSERLRRGTTPAELALALLASQEFWDAAGRDPGRFVDLLFSRVLGRAPGVAERDAQVARLAGGASREAVAATVFASEESRGRRVDALYQRFLGRAAEPDGRRYWVGVLERGQDISLALFLAASDEYEDRALRRFPPPVVEDDDDCMLDVLGLC